MELLAEASEDLNAHVSRGTRILTRFRDPPRKRYVSYTGMMTNNGFIHLRLYHRVEAGRSTRKEDKRGRRSSSYIAIEGTS
jgi:hypothetical protein